MRDGAGLPIASVIYYRRIVGIPSLTGQIYNGCRDCIRSQDSCTHVGPWFKWSRHVDSDFQIDLEVLVPRRGHACRGLVVAGACCWIVVPAFITLPGAFSMPGMLPLQPSDAFQNHVQLEDDLTQTCAHLHLPIQASRRTAPCPPAPIPIPSPVLRIQAPADLGTDPGIRRDIEAAVGPAQQPTTFGDTLRPFSGTLGFVGDLINGLRRLPRALTKSYHPNDPTTDRANDSDFMASYGHEGRLSSSATRSVRLGDEHSTSPGLGAAIAGSFEDDLRRTDATHLNSNPATPILSNSSQSTSPDTPASILADPKPASDYVQMGDCESSPEPFSDPTLTFYLTRLRRFFKAVNDLPWIAPRTTVDYIPGQGQSTNATKRSSDRRNALSWYAAPPTHHSLDILSSGPTSPESMTRLPDSTATLVSRFSTGSSNNPWPLPGPCNLGECNARVQSFERFYECHELRGKSF